MGLLEFGSVFVAVIAVFLGFHELYMWSGRHWWHGVYEVSHKLEETQDWGHPASFDPAQVRKFDKSVQVLRAEESEFLANLAQKHHDYNGYAQLKHITEDEYGKLEAATDKLIAYMNAFSGRKDKIDHLALRKTPAHGVKPHADNVHWEQTNRSWVPSASKHYTWSSVTMLTDLEDYKGGTFRFHEPKRQDVILGKGQTVVYESSEKNVHSMDTVPEGDQYALYVWLSEEDGDHRRKLMWRL